VAECGRDAGRIHSARFGSVGRVFGECLPDNHVDSHENQAKTPGMINLNYYLIVITIELQFFVDFILYFFVL
jgi:hypothetical protein